MEWKGKLNEKQTKKACWKKQETPLKQLGMDFLGF